MSARVDALEVWRRFGGGPKSDAEWQRRREIDAAMDGRAFDDDDLTTNWPAMQVLLAEIQRAWTPPRVAANAMCIVARGGKVGRQQHEYDPAAVWLALRARSAK